jgi:hypothetical protein
MVLQLRTYTIAEGMMDAWLELFTGRIRPIHEVLGMTVEGAWTNESRTEFVWLRGFASVDEIAAKEKALDECAEFEDLRPEARTCVVAYDVKLLVPIR